MARVYIKLEVSADPLVEDRNTKVVEYEEEELERLDIDPLSCPHIRLAIAELFFATFTNNRECEARLASIGAGPQIKNASGEYEDITKLPGIEKRVYTITETKEIIENRRVR
jgi:hypothetical protein